MRYYYNRKATADESRTLTVFQLKKWGMLSSGRTKVETSWTSSMTGKTTTAIIMVDVTNEPFVLIVYTLTDRDGNETEYKTAASLVTTPCNFGGERYWFVCPLCYSRVGALYLAPGDVYFRCRHCNNLSYRSRNRCTMEAFGHTSRQIDRLRSQIKRWTWRGRPTRKARRLQALEWKMRGLSGLAMKRIGKLKSSLR